jgi:hypothetical protein
MTPNMKVEERRAVAVSRSNAGLEAPDRGRTRLVNTGEKDDE